MRGYRSKELTQGVASYWPVILGARARIITVLTVDILIIQYERKNSLDTSISRPSKLASIINISGQTLGEVLFINIQPFLHGVSLSPHHIELYKSQRIKERADVIQRPSFSETSLIYFSFLLNTSKYVWSSTISVQLNQNPPAPGFHTNGKLLLQSCRNTQFGIKQASLHPYARFIFPQCPSQMQHVEPCGLGVFPACHNLYRLADGYVSLARPPWQEETLEVGPLTGGPSLLPSFGLSDCDVRVVLPAPHTNPRQALFQQGLPQLFALEHLEFRTNQCSSSLYQNYSIINHGDFFYCCFPREVIFPRLGYVH